MNTSALHPALLSPGVLTAALAFRIAILIVPITMQEVVVAVVKAVFTQ